MPRVSGSVVQQTRIVVTLVQILENRGEDFGFLVDERYPPALRIGEVVSAEGVEKRRLAEDVLMRCKEPPLPPNHECHDGGKGSRIVSSISITILLGKRSLQFRNLGSVSTDGARLLYSRRLVDAILVPRPERALEHFDCGD